ncbi:hypothetical protein DXW44_00870, partial [Salmonella enterica]|nr:hypothetical protein [Salmonella enterica]
TNVTLRRNALSLQYDVTNITLKNVMNITITNNYLNTSQKRLKSARLTRPPRASLLFKARHD